MAGVTVAKPERDSLGGAGHLYQTHAAGAYAGAGQKLGFGFNVKFNKAGKNLQGNANVIIAAGDKTYQIKSTAMLSLSADLKKSTATFESKASLADVTDPDQPISLGGNFTLQVRATDGSPDQVAIMLLGPTGSLLYSSHWDGMKTTAEALSGGNIVIR